MFLNSLSGRFLLLTVVFVMLAEVLIFVPSVARFREDYLLLKLEKSQIASLALLANEVIDPELEEELLTNADVFNVVLRRDEVRQLILSSSMPAPVSQTFDLRDAGALELIRDAMMRLISPKNEVIRVIGQPVQEAGLLIEVTTGTKELRALMLDYGVRILLLSAVISVFTATLLFLAVRGFLVTPIKRVVSHMQSYAAAPEDARHIIRPNASIKELHEAEEALQSMQTELTNALRQKERLAQLGGAVAKISHDLRNILTTAQLFTDRIEITSDPAVQRVVPKLVSSISRAVNLCETTLAFGKAEEPAPQLDRFHLVDVVDDIRVSEELAAVDQPITIRSEVADDFIIRADHEQLYRVLGNIVRNARQAIKATGQQGDIGISAIESDTEWVITVRDTGPGLPPRAQEKLFTAFEGGARKGGTGLGLVIAQELIRGHGGQLELLFTNKTGTAFAIRLPKGEISIQSKEV
ncbi:MAG: HAMP domain-containing sensor histidine kinase [Pseudoruegeria sp.]